MDVVTTARGKKTLEICTRKKEGRHLEGTLEDLDLGGSFSSTWMLAFESPGHHHHDPGCHPELGSTFWGEVVSWVARVGII
jgi:hypothetical protein